MISLRPAAERGHANRGWLDSHHSFSFADYHDPDHVGFGPLCVINEDRVQPGKGFGTHGHRDMEIVTYVLAGRLEHKDSMGNDSIIAPGDVQRMSAGTGVMHSEFNPSGSDSVHLLQIWIEPNVKGIPPSYEEARFEQADKTGVLRLIGSPDGRQGSVTIHQDAYVYATLLDGAAEVAHSVAADRRAYVHVARGKVELNGTPLVAGDAAKLIGESTVTLRDGEQAEVLVFDLP